MRLDGININTLAIGMYAKDIKNTDICKKEIAASKESVQKEDIAVKVSLSSNLLHFKGFKERMEENDPNDPLLSGFNEEHKMWLLAQEEGKAVIKEKYSVFSLGGGSGKAMMNRMLERYAKRYDELVQGHEDGMRSIFIRDSQTGKLRTMTLEEELQELDKSLKDAIDGFNAIAEDLPRRAVLFDRYADNHIKYFKLYGSEYDLEIAEAYRDYAADIRNDLANLPKTSEEREKVMYDAVNAFLKQYTGWKAAGMDIKSMVDSITIF